VIVNLKERQWALVTSIKGSTIYVNDPAFKATFYDLSEIVAGNSALFIPQ
jgi:hypothetical protein